MLRVRPLSLLGAFLASACGAGAGATQPTVVLVLVDQLRADSAAQHLSYTHALAERGVILSQMRAVAPWTYPSVISLFSGLYPQQHGADGDQEGGRLSTFSEQVPLLPRTLGAAGFHTAGFVTNPFLHEWNPVHQAFDHYDASFINNQGPTRGHGELVWTERMYADSVNRAVREHFERRPPGEPEFVYVHYIDVHGRREGPQRWQDAPFEPGYESAVRYVDGKIRELYEYFLARSGGELIFVVTSDHGQDLGDDIAVGDGPPWRARKASLHDFNLRIPFYVLPSARVDTARVVDAPCANIDVVPTLLEWLGLPPEDLPGRSLLPEIRGQASGGEPRILYAKNSAFGRLEDCIVVGQLKCLRYFDPGRAAVFGQRAFDLATDPRETRDLAQGCDGTSFEQAAGLHGRSYPAAFLEPDPDLQEQLQGLGYGGDGG